MPNDSSTSTETRNIILAIAISAIAMTVLVLILLAVGRTREDGIEPLHDTGKSLTPSDLPQQSEKLVKEAQSLEASDPSPDELTKVAELYLQAAELDNFTAMYEVGSRYWLGIGVP